MSKRDVTSSLLILSYESLKFWSSSDDISEDRLRHIIFRHESATNNNLHVSDYKFFHSACRNENITEGIIRCLLDYFPAAANYADHAGRLPIHNACGNKNVSLGIIQLLIDAAPDSVRNTDNDGYLPLHLLHPNKELDGTTAMHILRILLDAYPGSERIADHSGMLPLHHACMKNTIETVKYLYNLYPDAIDHATMKGVYPIHRAIGSVTRREDNPEAAVDIVKFLLDCDPRVRFQRTGTVTDISLLGLACLKKYNDTNIGAGLEMIGLVYAARPEAIEHVRVFRRNPQVRAFIKSQQVYLRLAKNSHLMTTPGENGQLPLHTALQNNAWLGSIMLLHQGNSAALQSPDIFGALPLHVACMYHESTRVVQYLIGLDPSTLEAVDHNGNTPLHYACRDAKYETIALLLGKYDAVSVSKRNAEGKLPIEVIWESDEVVNRESVEYTECLFRLLRAYPEITMNADLPYELC